MRSAADGGRTPRAGARYRRTGRRAEPRSSAAGPDTADETARKAAIVGQSIRRAGGRRHAERHCVNSCAAPAGHGTGRGRGLLIRARVGAARAARAQARSTILHSSVGSTARTAASAFRPVIAGPDPIDERVCRRPAGRASGAGIGSVSVSHAPDGGAAAAGRLDTRIMIGPRPAARALHCSFSGAAVPAATAASAHRIPYLDLNIIDP